MDAAVTVDVPEDISIPVVLREPMIYEIGYFDKRPPAEQAARDAIEAKTGSVIPTALPKRVFPLLPGLNYVPRSILEAARVCTGNSRSNVKVHLWNPATADEITKREIIEMTTSREALARWASTETDPEIRKAIEDNLLARAKAGG